MRGGKRGGRGRGSVTVSSSVSDVPKRGRGRPRGSTNKKKTASNNSTLASSSRIRKATLAAYPEDVDCDACNICEFNFSDPIKKDRATTYCPGCGQKVPSRCLEKEFCRVCNWLFVLFDLILKVFV